MRIVFPNQQFLRTVEDLLPRDRTDMRPSRHDFNAITLPQIEAQFSEHWDDLLPSGVNDRYRSWFGSGFMIPLLEVQGRLHDDGIIELRSLSIDWDFAPFEDDDR